MIQVVTRLGSIALATALSSQAEINFTRCAVGNGVFDPASRDAHGMAALIAPVIALPIESVRKEESGVAVVADLDNTMVAGGTEIREFGVFAQLNSGEEFLFSYAYAPNPIVVPPLDEATYERRFISHFAMSDDQLALTVTYNSFADTLAELLPGYLDGKLDKDAAGAAGGVAQLGSDGKVPFEQLPDTLGRGCASAAEVRARLYRRRVRPSDYYDSITDDQIAEETDVRAAWNGAAVETGTFPNVPPDVIATEIEVVERFRNE